MCIYIIVSMIVSSLTCVTTLVLLRIHICPAEGCPPEWLQRIVGVLSCRKIRLMCKECGNRHKIEDDSSGSRKRIAVSYLI